MDDFAGQAGRAGAEKKIPGVGQVRAKSSNQHVRVMFDSNLLDEKAIAEHVANVGYQTRVIGTPGTNES